MAVVTVALAVLLAASCGSGSTTEAGDAGRPVAVEAPQPAEADGLALRLAGPVEGDLICPGGRRQCLPYQGTVEPGADGVAWVAGRLVDGTFIVDDQQPLPKRTTRDYSNRCPGEELQPPSMEVMEAMHEDLAIRPPGYVDLWDSDDGVLHLGVAGPTEPAEAFLDEHGLADQVCLVTGFPFPDDVLETVQRAVGEAARSNGYDGFGVGRDGWDGTITIDLPRFDQDFRDQLDEISAANDGVPIIALAGVEVIDGSLADYEAALDSTGVTPDPGQQLVARCGPVTFSSVPPDLDEFPPLDDDAQAALDALVTGPTGVEAGGFEEDYRWSMAARTDDQLVLFGQPIDPDGERSWADARFERRDGAWTPIGWGGCWVQIEAIGLGPATVGLDPSRPPDPESTEIWLLINELACASGRAPTDREIVPVVSETDDTVTVIVLVAPVEGGAECPGNPWHGITVSLDAPLGSRQLLDGHRYPAQAVTPVDPDG